MKIKTLLFLIIFLGITHHLPAQNFINAGFQLGFNYSGFNQTETDNYRFENTINFTHGLFVEFIFSSNFSLLTNLAIVPRGVFIKPNSNSIIKQRIKLSYFQIPLLAKYIFPINFDNNKIYIVGGPAFGFSLQNYSSLIRNGQEIMFIQEKWNNTDGGVIIGFGFEGKYFSITFQNYQGINKLPIEIGNYKLKNRAFAIILRYSFKQE